MSYIHPYSLKIKNCCDNTINGESKIHLLKEYEVSSNKLSEIIQRRFDTFLTFNDAMITYNVFNVSIYKTCYLGEIYLGSGDKTKTLIKADLDLICLMCNVTYSDLTI